MFKVIHTQIFLTTVLFTLKILHSPSSLCSLYLAPYSFFHSGINSLERTINTCYLIFYHQSALVKNNNDLFAKYNETFQTCIVETFQLIMTALVFCIWFFLPMSPFDILFAKFFSYLFKCHWSWCSSRFFPQASSPPLSQPPKISGIITATTLPLGWWLICLYLPRSFLSTNYLLDTSGEMV